MRLKIETVFAVGLLGLVVGCSSEVGPKKYDVSGTVKVDGTEVAEGEIIFLSADQSVGAEGGAIKNGKYASKARDGRQYGQINSMKCCRYSQNGRRTDFNVQIGRFQLRHLRKQPMDHKFILHKIDSIAWDT